MCAPDFIAAMQGGQTPQPQPQPAPAASPSDLGPFAEDQQAARRENFRSTMQPYLIAQGPLTVPPDTMTDSPPVLVNPGVEATTAPPSDKYQQEQDRQAQMSSAIQQMQALSAQINQLPSGSPTRAGLVQRWSELSDQVDQLSQQFNQGPIGQWANRQADIQNNQGVDAAIIQKAIQERQNQPRQPLPPPAPGGVPLNAPIVPLTRNLTS